MLAQLQKGFEHCPALVESEEVVDDLKMTHIA